MIKLVHLNVECLSSPSFSEDAFTRFLTSNSLNWLRNDLVSPAENLVEAAGRVCYMSFGQGRQSGKSNAQYINHLIEQGHESVLEHVSWTFLLSGVSRAFTHQLVRHRVGFAYSQLSQQYHDESDASFVMPPAIEQDQNARQEWIDSVEKSISTYRKLISEIELIGQNCSELKKEKLRNLRSACRSILPNATETKIVVTANARAIRHFFKMRGAIEGDWEMRAVSCALFHIVSKHAPALFADFAIEKLSDASEKLVFTR